jgi:isocitrate/isopropylmalate dehydrogenase
MHLVMHPEKLDVLLLPNLYGDIVSDLCAGPRRAASASCRGEHGTGGGGLRGRARQRPPTSRSKNLAHPTALLLSGLLMLDHGRRAAARRRIPRGADDAAWPATRRGPDARPRRHRPATTEFTEPSAGSKRAP